MAIIASLGNTIVLAMKAIPTLGGDTDTIQIGGTTDGVFHDTDADESNVKPFRFYDLGSGHFEAGVTLRTADGDELGVDVPLLISQDPGSQPLAVRQVNGQILDADGNTPLIKTAVVDVTSAATPETLELLAAVTGKKIRVLNFSLETDAAVSVYFIDDAAVKLSPTYTAVLSRFEAAPSGQYLFETTVETSLKIYIAVTLKSVSVRLTYVEIPG